MIFIRVLYKIYDGKIFTLLSVISFILLTSCQPSSSEPGAGHGASVTPPGNLPPPMVSVVTAQAQTVPLTRELVGRLAATRIAQVRARVAGIILQRVYPEGTDVKAGEILFQIDPAQLQAKLNAAQAALNKAEADAFNAALTAKRYVELHGKHTLSQQDLDTAQANERSTAAEVAQARANLEATQLDLSYATVRAPIVGRAGRALVTEGALVGQNETTLLTTIEQIDPIYINFSQSIRELEELQKAILNTANAKNHQDISVAVILPSGASYPERGSLDFSEIEVDPSTGAVSLRAVIANPRRVLLPGMFVNVRLTIGQLKNAFLLPQAALSRDQQGAFVLIIDSEGKVASRRMETHGMTRTDWILTGELATGEQVIINGLQKVKPGGIAKIAPAAGSSPPASPSSTGTKG